MVIYVSVIPREQSDRGNPLPTAIGRINSGIAAGLTSSAMTFYTMIYRIAYLNIALSACISVLPFGRAGIASRLMSLRGTMKAGMFALK